MIALALAPFLVAITQDPASVPTKRNPRMQPLTVEDALYTIPEVSGRILLVNDLDGDGVRDLVVERSGMREYPNRIDAFSSLDGKQIRTLWSAKRYPHGRQILDAGGDVDADGTPDLLLGFPEDDSGGLYAGSVLVISGRTGEILWTLLGSALLEGFGSSVAFLGDINRDGHDDYAIGAPQADPRWRLDDPNVTGFGSHVSTLESNFYARLSDGTSVEIGRYYREHLCDRSSLPGFVSVRSGRDGAELWRTSGGLHGHGLGAGVRSIGDFNGDGLSDLIVQPDTRSDEPVLVLSGPTGEVLTTVKSRRGPVLPGMDVNGDGVPDLILEEKDPDSTVGTGKLQLVSGKTREGLFELDYLDMWPDTYGVTTAVGDLDGDGHGEIAIGEPNFHIRGPGNPGFKGRAAPDLRSRTLGQLVALQSHPWNAGSCESGCAQIFSGRTQKVILGAWGAPGSAEGLGYAIAALPDLNGDGLPDLIVTGYQNAYAFPGPGREPK